MALSEAEYKTLIAAGLLDTADGTLAAQLDTLWEQYDTIASLELRYRNARLAAIDLLLGLAAQQVSFRALDGASVNLSDAFDHLLKLRELATADLAAAGGGGGIALGQLTQTAPVTVAARSLDPNDRRYRGDALRRS